MLPESVPPPLTPSDRQRTLVPLLMGARGICRLENLLQLGTMNTEKLNRTVLHADEVQLSIANMAETARVAEELTQRAKKEQPPERKEDDDDLQLQQPADKFTGNELSLEKGNDDRRLAASTRWYKKAVAHREEARKEIISGLQKRKELMIASRKRNQDAAAAAAADPAAPLALLDSDVDFSLPIPMSFEQAQLEKSFKALPLLFNGIWNQFEERNALDKSKNTICQRWLSGIDQLEELQELFNEDGAKESAKADQLQTVQRIIRLFSLEHLQQKEDPKPLNLFAPLCLCGSDPKESFRLLGFVHCIVTSLLVQIRLNETRAISQETTPEVRASLRSLNMSILEIIVVCSMASGSAFQILSLAKVLFEHPELHREFSTTRKESISYLLNLLKLLGQTAERPKAEDLEATLTKENPEWNHQLVGVAIITGVTHLLIAYPRDVLSVTDLRSISYFVKKPQAFRDNDPDTVAVVASMLPSVLAAALEQSEIKLSPTVVPYDYQLNSGFPLEPSEKRATAKLVWDKLGHWYQRAVREVRFDHVQDGFDKVLHPSYLQLQSAITPLLERMDGQGGSALPALTEDVDGMMVVRMYVASLHMIATDPLERLDILSSRLQRHASAPSGASLFITTVFLERQTHPSLLAGALELLGKFTNTYGYEVKAVESINRFLDALHALFPSLIAAAHKESPVCESKEPATTPSATMLSSLGIAFIFFQRGVLSTEMQRRMKLRFALHQRAIAEGENVAGAERKEDEEEDGKAEKKEEHDGDEEKKAEESKPSDASTSSAANVSDAAVSPPITGPRGIPVASVVPSSSISGGIPVEAHPVYSEVSRLVAAFQALTAQKYDDLLLAKKQWTHWLSSWNPFLSNLVSYQMLHRDHAYFAAAVMKQLQTLLAAWTLVTRDSVPLPVRKSERSTFLLTSRSACECAAVLVRSTSVTENEKRIQAWLQTPLFAGGLENFVIQQIRRATEKSSTHAAGADDAAEELLRPTASEGATEFDVNPTANAYSWGLQYRFLSHLCLSSSARASSADPIRTYVQTFLDHMGKQWTDRSIIQKSIADLSHQLVLSVYAVMLKHYHRTVDIMRWTGVPYDRYEADTEVPTEKAELDPFTFRLYQLAHRMRIDVRTEQSTTQRVDLLAARVFLPCAVPSLHDCCGC